MDPLAAQPSNETIVVMDKANVAIRDEHYLPQALRDKNVAAYSELMRESVRLLGVDPESVTDQLGDLLDLERQLSLISSKCNFLKYMKQLSTKGGRRIHSMEELKRLVPSIDWDKFLRDVQQNEHPIHGVQLTCLDYFEKLDKVIASTHKRWVLARLGK